MGALLSLPLLAVPSMGTVCHPSNSCVQLQAHSYPSSSSLSQPAAAVPRPALWSAVHAANAVTGMSFTEWLCPIAHILVQCRNSYRIRPPTTRQLDSCLDHVNAVGHQKTRTPHIRLRTAQMRLRGLPWLDCRSPNQLCSRPVPSRSWRVDVRHHIL